MHISEYFFSQGDFAMNTPTGHGTYTWTDGSTYVGEVQNGIRHRQGTFTSSERSISYTGEWSYGKRHGKVRVNTFTGLLLLSCDSDNVSICSEWAMDWSRSDSIRHSIFDI